MEISEIFDIVDIFNIFNISDIFFWLQIDLDGGSSLGLSTFATPKIDTLGLPRLAHLASPKSTLGLPKLTH